jgi:hypothetical protein
MPSALDTRSLPSVSPLAGKPAPKEMLIDVARIERDYFERRPNVNDPSERVSFGTSGHRGSSLDGTFTKAYILAITPLAVAPLQDVLNLGNEPRMNVPGRPDGNWRWRYSNDMLSGQAFDRVHEFAKSSDRLRTLATLTNDNALEVVSR